MIRKFLDAQRIHNLTAYLQTLHRQSLANADHTTLLLNCYTKLKDSSKLEEFIKVQDGVGGRVLEAPLSMRWLHRDLFVSARHRERKGLTLFRGAAVPVSSVPSPSCFMTLELPMVSKPRVVALGKPCP